MSTEEKKKRKLHTGRRVGNPTLSGTHYEYPRVEWLPLFVIFLCLGGDRRLGAGERTAEELEITPILCNKCRALTCRTPWLCNHLPSTVHHIHTRRTVEEAIIHSRQKWFPFGCLAHDFLLHSDRNSFYYHTFFLSLCLLTRYSAPRFMTVNPGDTLNLRHTNEKYISDASIACRMYRL